MNKWEWILDLMLLPYDETISWLEGVVGPFQVVDYVAHDHGYSRLWRISAASDYVWLKMHRFPHKWAGEVHALTRWSGPLMPKVLAYRQEPSTVVITEMPGVDAESVELSTAAESSLWSEAGAWLRDFHTRTNDWIGEINPDGTPGKRTTTDPTELVRAGFGNRIRDGRDRRVLDAAEISFAEKQFATGIESLVGASIHSIHRDFHPRNWLADKQGRLTAVIDFEHARWDIRAADLNRPWDKEFHRNQHLIDAFYEAYGRPDDHFMAQIQTMRLYNAVTGLVWALEVGEPEFAEFNRRALHRLLGAG